MKIVTNKKIYIPLLLLVAVVSVVLFYYKHQDKHAYQIEVVKVEPNGYGYKILKGKQTVVYQPFVPALGNKQTFLSEEDATKVAQLVRDHFEAGENPSISKDDIRRLQLSGYKE